MRMPFSCDEPQSRLERVRRTVRDRASGAAHSVSGAVSDAAGAAQTRARTAAHSVSGAAGAAAQSAARSAAGAAQSTAHQVADRANVAAHQAADRAQDAASSVAGRARPLAAEARSRSSAAWQVLLHGAPQPSPLARIASVSALPLTAVTTVARRGRAPLGLMTIGAAGAVGVLLWRRSRAGEDSVWILDSDSDVEPVGRWQEGDRATAADDNMESGRRESPANRWP